MLIYPFLNEVYNTKVVWSELNTKSGSILLLALSLRPFPSDVIRLGFPKSQNGGVFYKRELMLRLGPSRQNPELRSDALYIGPVAPTVTQLEIIPLIGQVSCHYANESHV